MPSSYPCTQNIRVCVVSYRWTQSVMKVVDKFFFLCCTSFHIHRHTFASKLLVVLCPSVTQSMMTVTVRCRSSGVTTLILGIPRRAGTENIIGQIGIPRRSVSGEYHGSNRNPQKSNERGISQGELRGGQEEL